MPKLTPAKWKATDGREFDSEDAAAKHETFIECQRNYEDARRTFARVVWETQKTADGQPFDVSMRSYWYVWEPFNAMPELRTVAFYVWHLGFDDDDHGRVLSPREENGRQAEGYVSYRISELYHYETNARKALLEAAKKQLERFAERVAKMEHQ